MAKVTKTYTSVEYNLTLDGEEASLLIDILRTVSGDPKYSRRGVSDEIHRALTEAGAKPSTGERDLSGALYFEHYAVSVWQQGLPDGRG